ncbi:hypothetical protein PAPB9_05732 [Pseudomonas aeruginosa]|nr:hypothetical protein PAPB9_05732 [Pseudomonas aeruginosa]
MPKLIGSAKSFRYTDGPNYDAFQQGMRVDSAVENPNDRSVLKNFDWREVRQIEFESLTSERVGLGGGVDDRDDLYGKKIDQQATKHFNAQ